MFKNILVPLDGTRESKVALRLARNLAPDFGAAVTVLQVVPWPAVAEDDEATVGARNRLNRVAAELAESGIHVEAVVRHGEPADQILDQCRTQGADLILMRTHGRGGLERAVLGSVTQRVLQASRVPLLLTRTGDPQVSHIRSVLVPVDGSPGGAVALGTALRLAQSSGASVKLLEVVVPISTQAYLTSDFGGMTYIDPAWDDDALAAATTYVDGLVTRLQTSGVQVQGEAQLAPDVAATIVDGAVKSGVDMIVMSTQALTGPARALLGSVADAVVRHAHCPVLLLHRDQPADRPGPAEPPVHLEQPEIAGALR